MEGGASAPPFFRRSADAGPCVGRVPRTTADVRGSRQGDAGRRARASGDPYARRPRARSRRRGLAHDLHAAQESVCAGGLARSCRRVRHAGLRMARMSTPGVTCRRIGWPGDRASARSTADAAPSVGLGGTFVGRGGRFYVIVMLTCGRSGAYNGSIIAIRRWGINQERLMPNLFSIHSAVLHSSRSGFRSHRRRLRKARSSCPSGWRRLHAGGGTATQATLRTWPAPAGQVTRRSTALVGSPAPAAPAAARRAQRLHAHREPVVGLDGDQRHADAVPAPPARCRSTSHGPARAELAAARSMDALGQ